MLKLSIIIPVYNVAPYLRECLDSILTGNLEDIEIICVEDKSTDFSLAILEEYAEKDKRVQIYKHECNRGLSAARNTGMGHAQGEYVWFVDSDDYIKPNAIPLILELIKGEYDLIKFNTETLYEDKEAENKSVCLEQKADYKKINSGKHFFCEMIRHNNLSVPVWLMVLKKSWVFENNISFREDIIHEDLLYSLQCFLAAKKVKYIDKKLYTYRIRFGSLSNLAPNCKKLYSMVVVFDEIMQIAGDVADQELQQCLFQYGQDIAFQIRQINKRIPYDERIVYGPENKRIDLIFMGMGLGKYEINESNEKMYLYGFRNMLDSAEKIFLYGAGKVGKEVFGYLLSQKKDDKVKGFIVTERMNGIREYQGKPVYEISEVHEDIRSKDAIVILSAGLKLQNEMMMNCRSYGIENIVPLDRVLENHIRKTMGR